MADAVVPVVTGAVYAAVDPVIDPFLITVLNTCTYTGEGTVGPGAT